MSSPAAELHSAGDLHALLLPLLPEAYRLALCMCGQRIDADDLVQVAVFAARRRFEGYDGSGFRVWFYGIMHDVFVGRRSPADRAMHLDPYDRTRPAHHARGLPPRQGMVRADVGQILAAIDTLPERQRIVAALYFVDRLSYAEIGTVVRASPAAVRSRLHRGRASLQLSLS